jgi:methanesulfonate monooxygenase small subunit
MAANDLRAGIEEVLYAGCLLLDELRFLEWFELTAPELRYQIQTWSPEIRKQMTWLDHDRKGLAALVDILPRHHIDGAAWHRQAVLYTVAPEPDGSARTVTSLAIFHTAVDVGDVHLEAGSTRLFAVGHYRDRFRRIDGRWLLAERTVQLQTRQLGIGTHLLP